MVKLNWALGSLAIGLLSQGVAATMIPRRFKNETAPQKQPIKLMGLSPKYPTHQDTSKYCSYWYDNDGAVPCQDILEAYMITMDQLLRWVCRRKLSCGFNANISEPWAWARLQQPPHWLVLLCRSYRRASRHKWSYKNSTRWKHPY